MTLKPCCNRAFTLVELLVIIAMLALWAALLLPALAHTRPNSQADQCLNNLRQMTTAWSLYAADCGGVLVSNSGGGITVNFSTWATGWEDWGFGLPTGVNTNKQYLVSAALGPYTKTTSIYKCPADRIPSTLGPRIRSYSMNGFVGTTLEQTTFSYSAYRIYLRDSSFSSPGPARTFVFLDEHPDSINDVTIEMSMPNAGNWPTYTTWVDVPASHHNGAAGIAFADGHIEMHLWVDNVTRAPVLKQSPGSAVNQTSPNDSAWLVARTSAPR